LILSDSMLEICIKTKRQDKKSCLLFINPPQNILKYDIIYT
jgi:hypothetical protein